MRLKPFTARLCRPPRLLPLLLIAVLGLSACASLPDSPPRARLRDGASVGLPAQAPLQAPLAGNWWTALGDAQLNALIDAALAGHPSLTIAQARIAKAQAGFEGARAVHGPQLGLGLEATRQRFTANGLVPKPLAGAVYSTGTAQLSGSYEFDFFGKNRAALDAALGLARAAQADFEAARMVLASQVARSYFQWVRLQAHMTLAQRVLAQRSQALRLMQDRVNAGLDTQLDLQAFEASVPEARLQLEIAQEQGELARHVLEALVSKQNTALSLEGRAWPAPINIATITQLPFDLLSRRADLAAARWRVEAATQDLGNARAQFYPSVNLLAFAGFSSLGLDKLLGAGSSQWGGGPVLRLPLFDGGRLRANLRGKAADLDGAIESYNAVVLEAVREVADALSSQQSLPRQQAEQARAQALTQSRYDLAVQRFDAGVVNRLAVLNAEAALLSQQRQAIDLSARAQDTHIALMRALGGGYQPEQPTAAAAATATATASPPSPLP